MDIQRTDSRHRSKRKSGPFSDIFNVAFFVVALAFLLGILAVLDPMVKRWFARFLP